jgi:hypothetical protein
MKKLLLLFVAITMLSCSDDDSKTTENNLYTGDLVGSWKIINSTFNGYNDVDVSMCDDPNPEAIGARWTYVFNDAMEYKLTSTCDGSTIDYGTYTIANGTLTFLFHDSNYREKYELVDLGNNRIKMTILPKSEKEKVIFIVEKQ